MGSPFAGRVHPATRAMVGCCVSTLPLRARVSAASDTVADVIARARAAALRAYQNADAGLHAVMEALGRTHDHPLFKVHPQLSTQTSQFSELTLREAASLQLSELAQLQVALRATQAGVARASSSSNGKSSGRALAWPPQDA